MTKNLYQFVRYLISGGTAFVIDFGSFYVLHNYFGWWYIAAQANSYIFGLIATFTGHKYFVFRKRENTSKQMRKYVLLEAINFFIATGILLILVQYLKFEPELGKIISMGMVICWNFLMYKFFVYAE